MARSFEADLEFAKACLGVNFELKDKQVETLNSLYNGNDTLAILPTGFGKSIIYQLLPWLFQKKHNKSQPMVVIVVSPINSLMHDQVYGLCKAGKPACFLDMSGYSSNTYKIKLPRLSRFDWLVDIDGCVIGGRVDYDIVLSLAYIKRFDIDKAVTAFMYFGCRKYYFLTAELEDGEENIQAEKFVYASGGLGEIIDGNFCLIYAHPETLVGNKQIGKILRSQLYQERVCCTVVDEVHMISEWGTDFRTAFAKLGQLTCIFPDVPHLALTATATASAMTDVCRVLMFRNTTYVIQNQDRTNIYFEIRERLPNVKKYEKYDQILEPIIIELKETLLHFPVTIVYCDNLEALGYCYQYTAYELEERAYIPTDKQIPENRIFAQFHKDYTEKMKHHIISELRKENPILRLVFATVALGMGLNSPSICRIIHFRPPTTIETYVQEVGRAGRSGQQSEAILYFNNNDIANNRKGLDPAVKSYVKNRTTCLRKHLVNYFGFEDVLYEGPKDRCCSNCKNN